MSGSMLPPSWRCRRSDRGSRRRPGRRSGWDWCRCRARSGSGGGRHADALVAGRRLGRGVVHDEVVVAVVAPRSVPTCCPAWPTTPTCGSASTPFCGPVHAVGRRRDLDVDGLARRGEVLGGEAVVDAARTWRMLGSGKSPACTGAQLAAPAGGAAASGDGRQRCRRRRRAPRRTASSGRTPAQRRASRGRRVRGTPSSLSDRDRRSQLIPISGAGATWYRAGSSARVQEPAFTGSSACRRDSVLRPVSARSRCVPIGSSEQLGRRDGATGTGHTARSADEDRRRATGFGCTGRESVTRLRQGRQ